MKRSIRQLSVDVATLMGDALLPECYPEEGPYPSLEESVRIMAPSLLAELITETPRHVLSGWKPLTDIGLNIDSSGVATVSLPGDFLLFGGIRLTGWKRTLTALSEETDAVKEMLSSVWGGVRGSNRRPAGYLTISEGNRSLRISPASPGAIIEEGYYYPRPVIDETDSIEIPGHLYLRLLQTIVKQIKNESIDN